MSKNLGTIVSFLIYSLGLAAVLIGDLFVAKFFDNIFVADWAFIKSAMMIVSSICLLGYDVLFVRDVTLIKRYLKRFVIQAVLISLLAVILINYFTKYSFEEIVLVYIAVISLAFLNYMSAGSRATHNFWIAQLSNNLWKIILLISVLFYTLSSVVEYYFISILLGLIVAFFTKGFIPKEVDESYVSIPLGEANKMGFYFLLTNLTLIFAVHGEQFVINLYGDPITSSYLFTYFSVFTPIALSVNGFLGFYYGPKIRKEKQFGLRQYFSFSKKILLFSIIITPLSIIAGYLYMRFYMNSAFTEIDTSLVIVLSLLCVVRGVYVATSIGLGIFGTTSSLSKSAALFWVLTLLYIGLIILILKYVNGMLIPFGIALASLLNWGGRLIISNYFTIVELKKIKSV